jgi:hypothetical protein
MLPACPRDVKFISFALGGCGSRGMLPMLSLTGGIWRKIQVRFIYGGGVEDHATHTGRCAGLPDRCTEGFDECGTDDCDSCKE